MKRNGLRSNTASFLLSTESEEQFENERRGFESSIKPRNSIEKMYTDEISHACWQISRLRRIAAAILTLALRDGLFDILTVQTSELDRENAIVLVERWTSGDASAKADVSRILKKHGLDESAIEAAAFLRSLRDQLAIEQLQEFIRVTPR